MATTIDDRIEALESRVAKLEQRDRAVAEAEARVLEAALTYARMAVLNEGTENGTRAQYNPFDAAQYADKLLRALAREARDLVHARGMAD